jgi:hypothetical protein
MKLLQYVAVAQVENFGTSQIGFAVGKPAAAAVTGAELPPLKFV